jgi:hypothetical protein
MRVTLKFMAVAATLLGAFGTAAAQDVALKGNGPDAGQSNNERYTGIVDNSNNSYKTWPVSVRALWDQNEAQAARYQAKMARARQAAPPTPPSDTAAKPATGTSGE